MNEKFKEKFPRKKSLIVVIHVTTYEQAVENIAIAISEGADGAFLISHYCVKFNRLLDILRMAYVKYPGFWMGINWLDLSSHEAVKLVGDDIHGVWMDDFGISEVYGDYKYQKAAVNWAILKAKEWQGLYFGSIAFKYQPKVSDLATIAKIAVNYADVVVTSGEATGNPPDVQKIINIREAIGDFPLAIASGISPTNVSDYMDVVDCFMVATGISKNFHELDPKLVNMFVDKLRKGG